jgi:hypothetical protein
MVTQTPRLASAPHAIRTYPLPGTLTEAVKYPRRFRVRTCATEWYEPPRRAN